MRSTNGIQLPLFARDRRNPFGPAECPRCHTIDKVDLFSWGVFIGEGVRNHMCSRCGIGFISIGGFPIKV